MIVYSPSYAGLVQALKIIPIEDLSVISSNSDIVSFCEQFSIHCIILKTSKPKKSKEFIDQKKAMKELSKTIVNKDVLFCFYSFNILGLYLMYQLKKNNNVYFENKDHVYPRTTLKEFILAKGFYSLIDLSILFLLFGRKFRFFSITNKNRFVGIPIETLKKDFKELENNFNQNIFKNNQFNILKIEKIPKSSVIFIDEGNDTFILENEIITWLKEKYPIEKIFVKPHPNYPLSNLGLANFSQINKNIPMELLITSDLTLIGVSSTVLLDESIICKKISLIKLVKWRTEQNKKNAERIFSKLIDEKGIVLID